MESRALGALMICFFVGAMCGGLLGRHYGTYALWLPATVLGIVLVSFFEREAMMRDLTKEQGFRLEGSMQSEGRSRFLVIGIVLGLFGSLPLLAGAGYLYLRYGNPAVATADKPFPYEETIVHIPLDACIHRQLSVPPITANPDNLAAGAKVYEVHCVVCHGVPGKNSSFGSWEYPTAPQLWTKHPNGVVGVSDDPAPSHTGRSIMAFG